MNKEELKKVLCDVIDVYRMDIIEIGQKVLAHPEMGYKELKTSNLVKEVFSSLSLEYKDNLALTGVKANLKGQKSEINVAVLGELDAVMCPAHPFADKSTGAAHACGHNAQIASMLGTAIGLVKSNAMKYLGGDITFMAVPAEEFVELEYRLELKREGKIHLLGGKQELIRIGAFDDVDMAMMVHSQANSPEAKVFIQGGSTGFIGKTVCFKGREAHAGGNPHEGINALNAAMAAIMCIHAQRETFRDEDGIKVHPIVTKGGDLVNIVPADVRMETYVRGKTIEAVSEANKKVNRAIIGSAYAIGAEVEITEIPGYLPLKQDAGMSSLFKSNAGFLVGEKNIVEGIDMVGSSDIGDLGNIIPVIQPTMGGFMGSAHSKSFEIIDEEIAFITPAKVMAMTIIDLLWNEAQEAAKIKREYIPKFTKQEYLDFLSDIALKPISNLVL